MEFFIMMRLSTFSYFARRLPLLAVAAGLVISASSSAHAELIAYEGFDYAEGDLDGANGGTGWVDGWGAHQAFTDETDKSFVVSPGLSYTDGNGNSLPTVGRAVDSREWGSPFRRIDLSGLDPSFIRMEAGTPLLGQGDSTIWISFLAQGVESSNINSVSLYDKASFASGEEKKLGLGMSRGTRDPLNGGDFDDDFDADGRDFLEWQRSLGDATSLGEWQAEFGNFSPQEPGVYQIQSYRDRPDIFSKSTVPSTDKVFYVAKIEFNGTDEDAADSEEHRDDVTAWINPILGDEASLGTPDIPTLNVRTVFAVDILLYGPSNSFFDEIRIGTTYADVAPIAPGTISATSAVPEPASWVLACAMGLVVAGRRRRFV